ncbi:MAG: hypothetical protein RLP45_13580, partial [Haliea sp.]
RESSRTPAVARKRRECSGFIGKNRHKRRKNIAEKEFLIRRMDCIPDLYSSFASYRGIAGNSSLDPVRLLG